MSSARQIVSHQVLENYYAEASSGAELHTADVFWQAVFAIHFQGPDFLLTEVRPKDSEQTRRVLYFNPDIIGQRSIKLLWLEIKDASESGKDDDKHFVAMGANSVYTVYAMKVIGTTFRVRRIGDGAGGLEPVGGARTDVSEYIDAKSDEGCRVFFALRQEVYAAHKPSG